MPASQALPPFVFQENIAAELAAVHEVVECPEYSIRSGQAMPIHYFII
jgi:hypothetical protein